MHCLLSFISFHVLPIIPPLSHSKMSHIVPQNKPITTYCYHHQSQYPSMFKNYIYNHFYHPFIVHIILHNFCHTQTTLPLVSSSPIILNIFPTILQWWYLTPMSQPCPLPPNLFYMYISNTCIFWIHACFPM